MACGRPFTHPDYFFPPEKGLTKGNFVWLSAAQPIVLPRMPSSSDLRTWPRNSDLTPGWLRLGPTYPEEAKTSKKLRRKVPDEADFVTSIAVLPGEMCLLSARLWFIYLVQ
jgi:hypothetical protein